MGSTETVLRTRVRLRELLAQRKAADPRARVTTLADDAASEIADLGQQLADGDIDAEEFTSQVREVLVAAGVSAAALAGVSDDQLMADLLDGRADYLDGFATDVASGGLSVEAIAARAVLWGGLVWTGYQVARGQAARDDGKTQATWVLDAGAAHCEDCEALANGSPYSIDDLSTYPGDGSTACMGNCRCDVDYGDEE